MDAENIIKYYLEGNSINNTCKKYKIGTNKFNRLLVENEIKKRTRKETNKLLISKNSNLFKHSDETKKKISLSRKKYLRENKDKHVWKNKDKFISKPCEHLKNKLKEKGIDYVEEIQPLENRFYSIDIAIKNMKIGIEVNGNQHYNKDKELKTYYKDRHDNIIKNGWVLYEVYYTKCYDDNFIDTLIDDINGIDKVNLDFNMVEKKLNKCQCGNSIKRESKMCIKCYAYNRRKVNRPNKEVLTKDIELLGYSGTGRKYNVSDNTIRKWLK